MRPDSQHTCRTIGCDLPRDEEWHLLCPRCWEWVATATQERVLTEYRKAQGSAAHFQACSDARREATEVLRAR